MYSEGRLAKGLSLIKIEKKRTYNLPQILFGIAITAAISFIMIHMVQVHGITTLTIPTALAVLVGIGYISQELRPPEHLIFYMHIDEEKVEIWKNLFFTFDFISYDEEESIIVVTPTKEGAKILRKMMKEFDM